MPPKKTTAGPRRSSENGESSHAERLQKVLAAAGYGSRRQCEELIVSGRVEIDRKMVHELGTKVDPHEQQVRVDGVTIRTPKLRYFLVNKPTGVVSTAKDPWARIRVIDLVETEERLFTVGRLDKGSSGLILVTNDGQLANKLAHPRYGISKTYLATVVGKPSADVLRKLKHGVYLAEAFAKMQYVTLKKATEKKSVLEVVLTEGRNREIRRMLARVGHKVVQLKRIALGPIRLGELPPGAYRELTRPEINALKKAADGMSKSSRSKKKPAKQPHTAVSKTTVEKRRAKPTTSGTIIGATSSHSTPKGKKPKRRPAVKPRKPQHKKNIRKKSR